MHVSACIEWQFADDNDTLAGRVRTPKAAGSRGRNEPDTGNTNRPAATLEYRPTMEANASLTATRAALGA